ncbi:MAG TPA: glycosyltransferase [Bauldia sp.]|nr:glycosyltransferase [Bauldia sp.]
MKIVFVHRRGAAQFRHLARHLAERGAEVTVICEQRDAPVAGVRFIVHPPATERTGAIPRHLAVADECAQHANLVAETLERMRHAEGAPDLVVGHIGWGGMLFVKDVLPRTPALAYCEYYFQPKGGDIGFDPRTPVSIAELSRARLRNMVQRATLDGIEGGISPTVWQRSRYPAAIRPRIAVCHEGVDVNLCRPDAAARFRLPNGRFLSPGDPVVTYVARDLEPYRGFPQFMRAAARIAARREDALFVVAGNDGISYGRAHISGRSWRAVMMEETAIDPSRIFFLGAIDHASLIRLFQVSAAHVYLTVPFVLSWSLLEAMACGCNVVGSDTAPVKEVIGDGHNGVLADFWDADAIAAQVMDGLARPEAMRPRRLAARATIEQRYRRGDCLARQVDILGRTIMGEISAGAGGQ